jgi:L-threonylcarbamoyladenylate synthase
VFWPGPLTMILPRASHVLDQVTGGQNTVGLRVPNHPVALALLKEFKGGIAAPSANTFGRLSATRAQDVATEFQDEVSMVLDGGPCSVGIESTIVDLSGKQPRILRPGIISKSEIENVLRSRLTDNVAVTESGDISSDNVRAPGGLPTHYAPRTPLRLISSSKFASELNPERKDKLAVLSFCKRHADFESTPWIVAPLDPEVYARNLYASLRELDQLGKEMILVEDVPDNGRWLAIRDRLTRAAVNGA